MWCQSDSSGARPERATARREEEGTLGTMLKVAHGRMKFLTLGEASAVWIVLHGGWGEWHACGDV